MCELCELSRPAANQMGSMSRRSLFRQIAAGTALTVSAPLWLPSTAFAGDDENGGDLEAEGLGEDVAAAPSHPDASSSGGSTTTKTPAASGSTSGGSTKLQLVRSVAPPRATNISAPPIVTRANWGADESWRGPDRQFAPIRKLIVHHTASPNRPRSPASVVRETYKYHAVTRGFTDIGYNYMIDHKGVIYEGRYSRRFGDEPISAEDHNGWGVVGAHAKGANAGACGVCLIGNFEEERPTDAAMSSLQWLLAWKAARHRIDVLDTDPYVNIYGQLRDTPNLAGHRNVGLTLCPGGRLFKLLPGLRQSVAQQAGRWDQVVVDIPAMLRYEYGFKGQSALSGGSTGTSSSGGTTGTDTSGSGKAPSGTKAVGYRAITSGGTVMTAGKATKHGNASSHGTIAGFAAPGAGDGYVAVTTSGTVLAFGGLGASGTIPTGQTAVDIAVTRSGNGCWVLAKNGGIYPFGDAGYAGSPKRDGVSTDALRIAVRPAGDGYWVLGTDGRVRNFGNAGAFGASATSGAVDIAATSSGKGLFVLTADGDVIAFGDAVDKGSLATSSKQWAKPAAAITTLPDGKGYVISSRDGGLYVFGGAPYFGSFAGSGATVVGLVLACA